MWWLKRTIHIEWRIAFSCAGLLIGVACAVYVQIDPLWGIGAAFLGVLLFLLGRFYATALLFTCTVVIGLGYGAAAYQEDRAAYQHFMGSEITVKGRVKEDPSVSDSGFRSLQLNGIYIRGSPYGGTVFVRVRTPIEVLRSDIITVAGIAEPGFGNFTVNIKNASIVQVERQPMSDIGRVVRDWFASHVREAIPEPQASLGIGYLTGQKSALPEDLSGSLKIAGLTHIVVASGYNLTVLVRLARRLLLPVSKFSAAAAAVGMVLFFMTITGMSPSMTRAGIVSGLSILFWYYGRKVHPAVLLLFVAALTVLYQPSYLWGDLGWQLSFSAFFGVMVIGPLLQAYFFGARPPNIIRQTLGETIAAHIATVPVIALQFGVVSNVAIIANLLVVPLVPLAMLLTFITGLWVIFSLPFVAIVQWPITKLLEYMVGVAEYVAELQWAQSELAFSGSVWALYVVAVLCVCAWMWRASGYRMRTSDLLEPNKHAAEPALAKIYSRRLNEK